ncbi:unnamed protein product [Effrenium voratum]|uniref:Uncharacterized protein n=1 Tax=Effrenium voratum TaxID=2562239 RepID=A0AA36MX86_9DINO|nr:unnamed protein product [Effrenium voratum]
MASLEESAACSNCGGNILTRWALDSPAQWEPVVEPLVPTRLFALEASYSPMGESRARGVSSEVQIRRAKTSQDLNLNLQNSYLHLAPAEVEKQIAVVEQRIVQIREGDGGRVRLLCEQAKRLEEGLQAMRVAREIHDERRRKELKVVEGSFAAELERAASERQEVEAKLQETADTMLEECRADLSKEHSHRGMVHHECTREISEEVQRVHVLLEKQRASRLACGEQILAKLEDGFQKVHESIVMEQKLRFEAEGMMLRMVEDVCGRLHDEIQKERLQREAVQNKLLGLLEDTCTQIENSFSYLAESKGMNH